MGASPARSDGRRDPQPTINVTPLVDIVLVLLIIFMVVTPALAQGEQIELPEILKADPKPKDLNPIDVMLASGGMVRVDKLPIARKDLRAALERLHAADPERKLMLRADAGLDYAELREVFKLVQQVGLRGVSLKVVERRPEGS